MKKNLKSWKTTAFGIASFLAIMCTQVIAFTDGDPETTISITAIITALGLGSLGALSKDGDKSSEDVEG